MTKQVISNKNIYTSSIAKEASKCSSSELAYDYTEVLDDASAAIKNHYSSSNLDKRFISVATDTYVHAWDIASATVAGWRDYTYISMGMFAEMIVDIVRPKKALISSPDRHYNLVALLNSRNCELTFLNNECLFNFENFIRDLKSYPFEINYSTIDYDQISELDSGTYNFIEVLSTDLIINNSLSNEYIDLLESNGVIYLPNVNENERFYSQFYYTEPIVPVLDAFLENDNVFSYNIPCNVGFQIVIKK